MEKNKSCGELWKNLKVVEDCGRIIALFQCGSASFCDKIYLNT